MNLAEQFERINIVGKCFQIIYRSTMLFQFSSLWLNICTEFSTFNLELNMLGWELESGLPNILSFGLFSPSWHQLVSRLSSIHKFCSPSFLPHISSYSIINQLHWAWFLYQSKSVSSLCIEFYPIKGCKYKNVSGSSPSQITFTDINIKCAL